MQRIFEVGKKSFKISFVNKAEEAKDSGFQFWTREPS
jgi:hypothetical protein